MEECELIRGCAVIASQGLIAQGTDHGVRHAQHAGELMASGVLGESSAMFSPLVNVSVVQRAIRLRSTGERRTTVTCISVGLLSHLSEYSYNKLTAKLVQR